MFSGSMHLDADCMSPMPTSGMVFGRQLGVDCPRRPAPTVWSEPGDMLAALVGAERPQRFSAWILRPLAVASRSLPLIAATVLTGRRGLLCTCRGLYLQFPI